MKNILLIFIICSCFLQCKPEKPQPEKHREPSIITHATSFNLIENDDFWEYQLLRSGKEHTQKINKNQLPFKNMLIMSSAAVGYLNELQSLEYVRAAFNTDWIYNQKLHQFIQEKKIINAGNAGSATLETILSLDPDVIIAYTDPNQSKLLETIQKAGIPVILADEYLESTPLGKAEYLKLFGVLTGKNNEAEQLFSDIEKNYSQLKEMAKNAVHKPSVFADVMRGDIWYMPGGQSFSAQYFVDAGADYLWKDSTKQGTENLNFEQVFYRAQHADFWLNAADYQSLIQLKDAYKNHDWFDAYQHQKVYSLARRLNDTGASDYFETGTVRADLVLKDLVHIFHPELLPNHSLFFYHQLQ
ncbi:MAG: ABC transporter substrate-binding protein [Flavobacteriaceae bacterium]|nr:ABC transporter substrate-binding protein [Flavobacteriaceae bacterium]